MRKSEDNSNWSGWINTDDFADYSWDAGEKEITGSTTHTLSVTNKTGRTQRFQVEFSHTMFRLLPNGGLEELGGVVRIWETLVVPRRSTKTHANMPSAPCSVRTTTDSAKSEDVILIKFYTMLEPEEDAGGETLKTGHVIGGVWKPLTDDYVVP